MTRDFYQISPAAARVNAELTQEEVAKFLGVSKATIINWEKGITFPNVMQLNELYKLYNIPDGAIFFKQQST